MSDQRTDLELTIEQADEFVRAKVIDAICTGVEERIGPVAYGVRIEENEDPAIGLQVVLSLDVHDLHGDKTFRAGLLADLIEDADHLVGLGRGLADIAIDAGAAQLKDETFGDAPDASHDAVRIVKAEPEALPTRDEAWAQLVAAESAHAFFETKYRDAQRALEFAIDNLNEASDRMHAARHTLIALARADAQVP